MENGEYPGYRFSENRWVDEHDESWATPPKMINGETYRLEPPQSGRDGTFAEITCYARIPDDENMYAVEGIPVGSNRKVLTTLRWKPGGSALIPLQQ